MPGNGSSLSTATSITLAPLRFDQSLQYLRSYYDILEVMYIAASSASRVVNPSHRTIIQYSVTNSALPDSIPKF